MDQAALLLHASFSCVQEGVSTGAVLRDEWGELCCHAYFSSLYLMLSRLRGVSRSGGVVFCGVEIFCEVDVFC